VGARESGIDKFTCVWVTGMDGQVIALCYRVYNGLYVADIQARMNALRVEIQSQVYKIDISCPFSITEETTFDSVPTTKQTKFYCSNSSAFMTFNEL
jgi:hypothetical protein